MNHRPPVVLITGSHEDFKHCFLASDKARFLTGQCLAVDGGFTAQ